MSRLHALRALSAAAACILGSSSASARTQAVATSGDARRELASKLDDDLTRSAAFGFSGAVLVVRNGEPVLCKGYGIADRSRATPFTSDTAFDLASVTKQITSAAVLKLEMLGTFRTSDRIAQFLEGVPEDKAEITVHQLLAHTAGGGPGCIRCAPLRRARRAAGLQRARRCVWNPMCARIRSCSPACPRSSWMRKR